jgi:hypothetical protein
MKLSLLLCALILSIPGCCSSAIGENGNLPNAIGDNGKPPNAIGKPHKAISKPFRERQLYEKGKGTMGLILALVLGPVGYAGVHIFSHNRTTRDKAKNGMEIWLGVVLITGFVWCCIESRQSVLEIFLQMLANTNN